MNQDYFEEKRGAAADETLAYIQMAEQAHGLIRSANYQLPDLVSPKAVHDVLTQVARSAELPDTSSRKHAGPLRPLRRRSRNG